MTRTIFFLYGLALIVFGCNDEFLDAKPSKALVIPTRPEDLQALLDNTRVMNGVPGLTDVATDDVFTTASGLTAYGDVARNSYLWAEDIYEGAMSNGDWSHPYEAVFYSNVALTALDRMDEDIRRTPQWTVLKGSALFYRAHAHFHLAKVFAPPYGPEGGLGIPLRLTADVNAPVTRAGLDETYARIAGDLTESLNYLPDKVVVRTRPSKAAAHALLSRVYLSMSDFVRAEEHATAALELDGTLLDYNTVDAQAFIPFPGLGDEVLFHASMYVYLYMIWPTTHVDPTLYASYDDNDLRKEIFFRPGAGGRFNFKGHYTGQLVWFAGIANDELYLTRAECRARRSDIAGALSDLNTLLAKRWRAGTFVPVDETDEERLLEIILEERRKELLFRGIRWMDLRRLNLEERFRKTLVREIDGVEYKLTPNSARYVFPIPHNEIVASGIEQNPR